MRLGRGGFDVPISKSFILLDELPLLYWCLLSLLNAGIEKIVVTADDEAKINKSKDVVKLLPNCFAEVKFYLHPGYGTTGLPWHARAELDDMFFFECGHAITLPDHYHRMDRQKTRDNIVLSGFNSKQVFTDRRVSQNLVLSPPYLFDQDYAERLPSLKYDRYEVMNFYSKSNKLKIVKSEFPPEFDVIEEWEYNKPIYRKLIKNLRLQYHKTSV